MKTYAIPLILFSFMCGGFLIAGVGEPDVAYFAAASICGLNVVMALIGFNEDINKAKNNRIVTEEGLPNEPKLLILLSKAWQAGRESFDDEENLNDFLERYKKDKNS